VSALENRSVADKESKRISLSKSAAQTFHDTHRTHNLKTFLPQYTQTPEKAKAPPLIGEAFTKFPAKEMAGSK
jgi:hypothetical protein